MLIETLTDLFLFLVTKALEGIVVIGVPLHWLEPLNEIFLYGIWVAGADTVALFASMIATWWMVKLTVGIIVWIWELLPFT